jgi:Bacterial membrane protein YfhO
MKKSWLKKITPHIIAVVIFVVLGFVYCSPVIQGETVNQSDMVQVKGMSKEAVDFYNKTGEHPLWSNSMFCGMPTYLTFTGPSANLMQYPDKIYSLFLPSPVNMLFIAMLGFYILLCILEFDYLVCLFGAIAYGFSSFNVILINAGHVTEMMSMAFMAPVIGSMILTYRGKYLLGGTLTALFGGLLLYNNHLQITYYTLILATCLSVGYFVHSWQEKKLKSFFIATAILIGAAILAALPATDNLLITKQYSKYSIRDSQSQLNLENNDNQVSHGGLDIDYAFDWSLGKLETLSIIVPNIYAGSVPPNYVDNSSVYKTISAAGAAPQQAEQAAGQIVQSGAYWGPQPGTEAVYFGAIICFLFVLSLFLVKSWHKWWLLAVTVIAVIMSWGKNFPAINDFLFYHLPLYNKFRSPSMILVIPQVTFVLLAAWALQEIFSGRLKKDEMWKAVKRALYITGGVIIIIGLGILLDYKGANDDALAQMIGNADLGQKIISALREDRASMMHSDAIRSFIFILIAVGVLWAYIKGKIKWAPMIIILGLVMLIDLWQVDKRYLNENSFTDDIAQNFQASPAEQQIMQDTDPYYRVLNLSVGMNQIFNGDALTSYYLKSIGGYSPAKLWRYQDLIDFQLNPAIERIFNILQNAKSMDSSLMNVFTSSPVLNMLNTKYFIINPQAAPVKNPDALGNAWFIKNIDWVPNANKEMSSLNNIDPGTTVVINQEYKNKLNGLIPEEDSSASIKLTQYGLNELKYASDNSKEGFGVFSDIYYPAGWKAYIDGKEVPIIRVNYLLRGLVIPAGKHDIDFKFHPDTYFLGQKISFISSLLIIVILTLALIKELYPKPEKS